MHMNTVVRVTEYSSCRVSCRRHGRRNGRRGYRSVTHDFVTIEYTQHVYQLLPTTERRLNYSDERVDAADLVEFVDVRCLYLEYIDMSHASSTAGLGIAVSGKSV